MEQKTPDINPDAVLVYCPPDEPVNILYHDDDILVVDKPSGLLHVPGRDPRLWDCLDVRVKKLYSNASIIHRLDCDTSGVVVMGLNKSAHAFIANQFENRSAKKTYVARVWGLVNEQSGHIDLPLAIDPMRKPRHRVDFENGRPAQTDWELIAHEGDASRLRLFPRTGRTHQLRVHMLAIGHPIVGDPFYAEGVARTAAQRLQLHAEELRFIHPATHDECVFTAPCPF